MTNKNLHKKTDECFCKNKKWHLYKDNYYQYLDYDIFSWEEENNGQKQLYIYAYGKEFVVNITN